MSSDVNSHLIQRLFRKFFRLFHSVFMNFEWTSVLILASLPLEAFEENLLLRRIFFLIGVLSFGAGLFMRLWARGYNKKKRFILDGPYRYVQNPDELGSLLLYVGTYLALGVIWSWVLVISLLALAYFACVSGSYEEKLKKKIGATFPRYRLRVRRWFPSIYPAVNRSGEGFNFKKAIKEEYSTWVWILAIGLVVYLRRVEILPLP